MTKEKKQIKYIPIQTDTGNYMIYIDWSIDGKLNFSVWDEDGAEDETIWNEEIDL